MQVHLHSSKKKKIPQHEEVKPHILKDNDASNQHVTVNDVVPTEIRHVADSLRALTLMPLSVLPWAHQLPGLRLTQLLQAARSRVVEQWSRKVNGSPAFRLKE